jgi:hypothetical protein
MKGEYDMQPIFDVMDSAIERLKALLSVGKKKHSTNLATSYDTRL